MGNTSVTGRLPPEIIQRIVRQNFGRFRLCYENGLRQDPKLQGRVAVRFVIDRDGSVSNVSGGGDLPDEAVIKCVTRAFHGLSFPKPEGGIVRVTYPIVFTPGDGDSTPRASRPGPPTAGSTAPSEVEVPPPPVAGPTDGLPYKCVAARTADQPCASTAQCDAGLVCRSGQCTAAAVRVSEGGKCLSQLDCELGLYCAPSEAGSFVGTCQPRKPTGSRCNSSLQCQGYCPRQNQCASLCGQG